MFPGNKQLRLDSVRKISCHRRDQSRFEGGPTTARRNLRQATSNWCRPFGGQYGVHSPKAPHDSQLDQNISVGLSQAHDCFINKDSFGSSFRVVGEVQNRPSSFPDTEYASKPFVSTRPIVSTNAMGLGLGYLTPPVYHHSMRDLCLILRCEFRYQAFQEENCLGRSTCKK